LPGATAFVPALVNSGLPNDKFVFEGFLPDKRTSNRYLALEETRTMILYVSPHKLVKTLNSLPILAKTVKFQFLENYQTARRKCSGTERGRCSF
jgi:16S rRNA C1402 (ribose-2'-O) methylase RsmI